MIINIVIQPSFNLIQPMSTATKDVNVDTTATAGETSKDVNVDTAGETSKVLAKDVNVDNTATAGKTSKVLAFNTDYFTKIALQNKPFPLDLVKKVLVCAQKRNPNTNNADADADNKTITMFNAMLKKDIENMFDQYDTDNNGFLDPKEEKGLVNTFLIANSKQLSAKRQNEFLVLLVRETEKNWPVRKAGMTRVGITKDDYKECYITVFDTITKPAVEKACEDILHDHLKRIDEICAAIFSECDVNHDGNISKDELCDHFLQAMADHLVHTPESRSSITKYVEEACKGLEEQFDEEIDAKAAERACENMCSLM